MSAAWKLLALGVAGALLAGCHQQAASEDHPLAITAQVQVDGNGAPVAAVPGVAAADPAGNGSARCAPVSLAMMGPLTGPDAALGANMRDGAQLAIDTHNAANPACQVTLKPFDTEGDPQKATAVTPQVVDDGSIVGLVGPGWSGETKATGSTFDQAGLVAVTASATNETLSTNGWKTFFRGLGNDGIQGRALANYLTNTTHARRVCVIDDGTDYGLGLATTVRVTLGTAADSACNVSVKRGDKDFSAAVNQIRAEQPDAVFYGGYYTEAALVAQQLRDGGVDAVFAAGDGSKDPEFVKQAGSASSGALLFCPCSPVPDQFAARYRDRIHRDPGTYSVESYDVATILLAGIDSGASSRAELLEFIRHYQGAGLAHAYQWDAHGELANTSVWIYRVQ